MVLIFGILLLVLLS